MSNNTVQFIRNLLFYFIIQVLFLRNVVLFDYAFCFIYVMALLMAPLEYNRTLLLVIGFFLGLGVDMFYDSQGLHAAASVLMMFLRPFWFNSYVATELMDQGSGINVRTLGLEGFVIYAFPLILAHHFLLFYVEAGGFQMFLFTFVKVVFSAMFTFITALIIQFLLYRRRRAYE